MSRNGRWLGLLLGFGVTATSVMAQDEPAIEVEVEERTAIGISDGSGAIVVGSSSGDGAPLTFQVMAAPSMIGMPGSMPDSFGLLGDERIRGELGLADDQWSDIQRIQKDFEKRMQEATQTLMEGGRFDPSRAKEMRGVLESVRTEMKGRLADVLLPHQQKRLEQLGRHVYMSNNDLDEALMDGPLAEELGVTEEQKKRLRERYTEIQAETEEAIRKIRREAREKLLKELTGSQREKLADLLGDDFDYQPHDMRAEMRRMRDEARRRRAEEAEKKD